MKKLHMVFSKNESFENTNTIIKIQKKKIPNQCRKFELLPTNAMVTISTCLLLQHWHHQDNAMFYSFVNRRSAIAFTQAKKPKPKKKKTMNQNDDDNNNNNNNQPQYTELLLAMKHLTEQTKRLSNNHQQLLQQNGKILQTANSFNQVYIIFH